MKKFRFAVLTVVGFLMVLTITTCKKTVALGSTVDILPPTNSFDRPVKGDSRDSLRGSFSLNGVAKDDSGVRAVKLIFKSKTPGVNVEKTYMTNLDSPGAPETNWSVNITNEWTGMYLDSYNLIKEYPLPDSEYEISIITIDKQGREATHTTVLTIDNTPPVFIVDNFTDARTKDELGKTAGTQTFGSILNVIGTAGDTSDIQSLKVTAYSTDGASMQESKPIQLGGTKQINNNIATTKVIKVSELTSGDYYDFWQLQGADLKDKNIIMDIFLSDKAQPFGSQGTESGNISEFFYLRDDLQKAMAENGYTVQTFSDYISGRKPWDDSQSSKQLKKLIEEDTDTLRILNEKRYWNYKDGEGTATSPVNVEKDKVVFQLAPGARPGYTVTNYKAIGVGESVSPMYADSFVTITVERNTDKTKIADPKKLDEIKKAELKLLLIQKNDGSTLDAFISQLQTNQTETGAIAAIKTLFDKDTLNDISDPYKFEIAGDTNFSIQFKLPADTKVGKTYALILQGHDEIGHDLIVYGEGSKPLADKFVIFEVKATGNPPQIDVTKLPTDWTNKKLDVTFNITGASDEVTVTVDGTIDITNRVKVTGDTYALGSDGNGLDLSTVSGLTEGEHTLTVYAKQGDLHSERKCTFRYDKTKPVIEITEPTAVGADGQTTTTFDSWSPTFTLKVDKGKDPTTLPSMSPRKSLKFQISYDNGATFEAKEYNASLINGNDEYEAIVNVTSPSFAVKFIAEDMVGNTTELTTKSFTVSTDKPQIETVKATVQTVGAFVDITGNTGNIGTYISKKLVDDHGFDIQVIAKKYIQKPGTNTLVEDTVKVNKVEFIIDGTTKGTIADYNIDTKNTIHSDELGLTSTNMADGVSVTIRVTAEDGKQQETTLTFRVDSTPPELKITSPVADGQAIDGNTKIAGYAADSESGIKEASQGYTYKIVNTADNSVVPGASGSLKWDNQTNPTEWTIPNPFTANQAEGEYKIIIENIKDDAGNTLPEVEKKVTIDKTPPALTVASYADETNANALTNGDTSAQIYKNSDFWLAGTAEDSNALDDTEAVVISGLGTDSIKIAKNNIGPDKKWKYKVTGLSEGRYTATVTAKDVASKVINKQVTVVYDKTLPKIESALTLKQNNVVVDPTSGWFGVGPIEISGKAHDNLSGVAKVEYSVDGGNTRKGLSGTNSFSGIVTVTNTTPLLKIRVTDNAGNFKDNDIALSIDSTKPTVKVEKINGEAYTHGEPKLIKNSPLSITVSNTDVGSGFDHYEYKVGADEYQTLTVTAGVGSITIPSDTTVKIRAVDKVGLYSDEVQIPVQLDDMEPTVAFNRDVVNGTVNKTITISGTATDNRGLAKVELTINGIKAGEATATNVTKTYTKTGAYNWSETLDTTTYKDNTDITLTVVATDEAGNVSTSDTRVLTIDQDSDRPQIVVQGPTALTNGTLNSNSVTGSITDDDGVKELYISQNDTDWGSPVTLINGINWSYHGLADGDRTLYFKVVDVAGTTFISSTTADQLTLPKTYLSDKTSTPIGAPATFMVDTKKPDIMEVKTTVDSKTNVLMQNALFKVDSVILTVVAKDTNGIQSVVAKLAGQSDVTTLTGEAGNTANSNETFTGVLALGGHGVKELEIEVKDKTGAPQTQSYSLRVDKQGPAPLILYPKDSNAVAGTISISGSISDDSKVSSGVDANETKYFFANNNDEPTESSAWKNMKTSTVANFSFDYSFSNYVYNEGDLTTHDDDVLKIDGTAVPADWKVPDTDQYKLPLWIRSKDMAGNVSITKFTILYNAVAEKPVLTIVSPTSEAKVGGTFTIFGTAKVDIGTLSDVKEGYIQFSKSTTFDATNCNINGVNFWEGGNGVSLTSISNGSWNYIANADSKLDPKGANQSWNLYVRVRGKNTTKNRLGDWTDPIQITVDKDTPTINSAKVQKGADPAQNYTSNMWVSDDCVLTVDLQDASGLKEIKVMFGYYKNKEEVNGNGNNEFIFKKGETKPTWLMENGTVATGGKNYKLKLPMDLTKLVPDAQTNQTFKVNVFIQEDTNQNLNNSMEFVFRYDKLSPNGAFGEKIESGNANFDTGSVTNTRLAEAVGNFTGTSTKLILVDNVIVTPKSRTGDTVTFNETITGGTHNYIVYEPKAIIKGSFQAHGVANDDGSGVKSVKVQVKDRNDGTSAEVESTSSGANRFTREYGNQVVWNADIDVSGLADGLGTVICTITDDAGNTQTSEKTVFISNKPITPVKLTFGTDLDANGTVDSNEVEKLQLGIDKDTSVGARETLYRGSVNFGTWTFKNVKSNFAVEFTGGNNGLKYTLSVDNAGTLTALTNHENKTISSTTGEISLNAADFDQIGDGTGKKLVLKLIDDSGWTATVNITVNVQIDDTDAPTSAILPFYWNSKTDNSFTGTDGVATGHIEYGGAGSSTNDAISGTVVIKGVAYDEKLLTGLQFNFDGIQPSATFSNGSWTVTNATGVTLTVTNVLLDQSGHYVQWEATLDSEKLAVGRGKTLTVTAKDTNAGHVSPTNAGSVLSETAKSRPDVTSLVLADGTTDEQLKSIKVGQTVRLYTESYEGYYARVSTIDTATKTITLAGNAPVVTATKYEIYTDTVSSTTKTVDVVPYITKVETGLNKAYKSNPSTFNRSALGWYPVQVGESITVNGFNMTGSTVKIAGSKIATTYITTPSAGKMVITIPQGTKSGALELEVNSIKSINNTNKNPTVDGVSGTMLAAYNSEANGVNNDRLTDDRMLYVWKIDSQVSGSQIKYPTMRVGKDANQTVTFVYAYGSQKVKMHRTGITTPTDWILGGSYSPWNVTAVAVDDHGRVYAASENTDSGSSGTVSYNGCTNYMFWAWMQGDGRTGSSGAYSDSAFARALESNYNGTLNNTYRISSPKIAVRTDGTGTAYVYTAYFDTSENQVKFRYGTVKGSVSSPTMTDALVSHERTGNGSGANFQVVAGTDAQGNDSEGNTNVDRAGDYVAVGTTSNGTAVIAWYDATNQALMYSYNDTPQLNDSPANLKKWGKNTKIIDANLAGWYVDLTVDEADGIHIAYYSMADGDLKYAYLSSINAEPQIVTVDSYLSTGTNITIDTKKKIDGGTTHYVPYISYYMTSFTRTAYAVRTAWLNSVGQPNIPHGVDGEKYTGDWEVQTVPVQNRVSDYTVGIGIKKNSSDVDSIILGYGTDKDLQSAILE